MPHCQNPRAVAILEAMSAIPIRGLVLAGGRSRRFGGVDKTFAELCGRPLWEHVLTRLAPQVDAMAISSNDRSGRLETCLHQFAGPLRFRAGSAEPASVAVIPDLIAGHLGPLAGIHAGLRAWPDCFLATVAVDLPFIPPNLVERLVAGLRSGRCAYATDGTRHALAVLWGPGNAASVEAFLSKGGRSVHEWLERNGDPVRFTAPADGTLFSNINTPHDLELAERQLQESGHCRDE